MPGTKTKHRLLRCESLILPIQPPFATWGGKIKHLIIHPSVLIKFGCKGTHFFRYMQIFFVFFLFFVNHTAKQIVPVRQRIIDN